MGEHPKLHVLAPAKTEPNQSAIILLEEALEKARSGEVTAVALILVDNEQMVTSGWSEAERYHLLNSGAARLAARLANEP